MRAKSPQERFQMSNEAQQQIERLSERIPLSGCWIWTGAMQRRGYGQLTFEGKHKQAHRASFEAFLNPIPKGKWVLHRCDVRACVNPHHLYAGTAADNRRDTLQRSDWSHPLASRAACSKGHIYFSGSFRIAKDGSRVCKECMRDHMRTFRSKAK